MSKVIQNLRFQFYFSSHGSDKTAPVTQRKILKLSEISDKTDAAVLRNFLKLSGNKWQNLSSRAAKVFESELIKLQNRYLAAKILRLSGISDKTAAAAQLKFLKQSGISDKTATAAKKVE